MNALSDLFPKARAEILRLLFETADREIHLRDLARLAALSPAALQKELTSLAAKELVDAAQQLPLEEGIRLERRLFHMLAGTEDKAEGMAAFVDKRPPVWKGR